jgi:hypothetical protein
MADVISEYQRWKEQGENLRTQAKQAMESRFRELLSEAVAIAEEYRADFGAPLKPPAAVTAFRYKASGKPRPKKGAKEAGSKPAAKPAAAARPEPAAAAADPKTAKLQKRLEGARKKLADAKAAGTPTRALEDRVYEIEDALRLANEPS